MNNATSPKKEGNTSSIILLHIFVCLLVSFYFVLVFSFLSLFFAFCYCFLSVLFLFIGLVSNRDVLLFRFF